jgi:hypothetical protein
MSYVYGGESFVQLHNEDMMKTLTNGEGLMKVRVLTIVARKVS